MTAFELYQVDENTYTKREMLGKNMGIALGDVYVQSRFRLIPENEIFPNIIIQSTLKTATGTQFYNRRYFDTPSYYFDLEIGKNFICTDNYKLRVIADIGFFSWQMYSSVQNDAPMYSLKTNFRRKSIQFDTEIAGYSGWKYKLEEVYGDRPVIWRNRLNYFIQQNGIFCSFEKGLRDYPYQQINIGLSVPLHFMQPYRSIQ